jgi:[citrate (pro-3S)-lyase] ligase
LEEYLEQLESGKISDGGVIGAVVMNCNPFTLGHRFLVEEALRNCEYLYIFVVEENKSRFPFEDRIKLVKEGVSDLKNVKVFPSGKFIISTLTFPEYFIEESYDVTIDATQDIELFAKKIAPVLNIKKRFAGQEPFSQVTRQYNRAMKEILPLHGIEFIVFNRKEADDEPISASKVRKLLEGQEYDEIKKLVPESTFGYLLNLKKNSADT